MVGITIGVASSLLVGTLAGVITGTNVILGTATGPETAFGGEISGEKILPLWIILLVPTMY